MAESAWSAAAAVFRDGSPERAACEQALAAAGVRLPLPHRAGWALARRRIESRCVSLPGAAFAVELAASRALPGYRVVRVERFGEALPDTVWPAAVHALEEMARAPRVLRVSVEVFSRHAETRGRIGELLAAAGFARADTPRNWTQTLALDLGPREDQLIASFSELARRGIRAVHKHPVEVRTVDDPALGDRLDALMQETFARTGAPRETRWDWAGVIELSRRASDASRLVGLFRTDRDGPDALLGFAWGWWNGQSVSYWAGASTRPKDLRVHIVHPLFWDLILWAKRGGATWFDLGGVTAGTAASGDPVGGISDFKRLFSKETTDVAEDWVLHPRRWPARLASVVSTGAAWLARARRQD
jgi:hypothetical protein